MRAESNAQRKATDVGLAIEHAFSHGQRRLSGEAWFLRLQVGWDSRSQNKEC